MKNLLILMTMPMMVAACTPTVKLEAPDKPIEINMNIKIEQEVRVRVEKDLDKEIMANPDLFGTSKPAKKK
ncbi:MAG TPA: YnbE family lipoprotein [Rhodospirillaceae bacterium]|nr:YnbE family lipoprotein [Rhodospirillaceae bacterium]